MEKKVLRFVRLKSLNPWDFVEIRAADISHIVDMENDWS